jgi:hypothetical protein
VETNIGDGRPRRRGDGRLRRRGLFFLYDAWIIVLRFSALMAETGVRWKLRTASAEIGHDFSLT